MKIRRHKHTKRVLKFYKTNYSFEYEKHVNILIDGTFAHQALESKINIADQMPKFFDLKPNNCRLCTTKCALKETEMLGRATHGAWLILKQYELVECQHSREYVNAEKCFKNLVANQCVKSKAPPTPTNANDQVVKKHRENKFFVATQVRKKRSFIYNLIF